MRAKKESEGVLRPLLAAACNPRRPPAGGELYSLLLTTVVTLFLTVSSSRSRLTVEVPKPPIGRRQQQRSMPVLVAASTAATTAAPIGADDGQPTSAFRRRPLCLSVNSAGTPAHTQQQSSQSQKVCTLQYFFLASLSVALTAVVV